MAQTGYTPISLYYTTTAAAVPTAGNLVAGELALNTNDGKLYYKNSSGVVTLLAGATAGPAGGSNTQVQYNSSGVLAGSANLTFNGNLIIGSAPAYTPDATWNGTFAFATGSFGSFSTNTHVTQNGYWNAGWKYLTSAGATNLYLHQNGVFLFRSTAAGVAGDPITWTTVADIRATNAIFYGGINSTAIGATTPSTGAFTTLSATGLISAAAGVEIGSTAIANQTVKLWRGTAGEYGTVGVTGNGLNLNAQQGYVNLQLAGVDKVVLSSTGLAVTGTLSSTLDATIYGVTVGRGGGAVSTNTAVGASAGYSNTTGTGNVALGTNALLTSTTGTDNTATGYQAFKLATGSYNIAVGSTSMRDATTGSNNVAVGYATLANNTGNNNAALGNQAVQNNTSGAFNVGVGSFALFSNTTASNNTAVGYQAGYTNTTGAQNTDVGMKAGYLGTVRTYTTSMGYFAGYSSNGTANTYIGYASGPNNGTASVENYNTGIGAQALNGTTTGGNNTAVGYQAGYSNTTATGSTAVGYQALYTSNRTADVNAYNSAFGYQAGFQLGTGQFNTFIGLQAGYSCSSGAANTFIGVNASGSGAGASVTGSKNVIIGGYTGSAAPISATGSNYIVLSDGDGNVRGTFDSSGNLLVKCTTKENRGVTIYGSGANGIYAKSTGTTNYWITNDGLGTGAGTIATIYNDTTSAGQITVLSNATAYTSVSDYRLKDNVQLMTGALDKVLQLKPVTYTWKVDGVSGQGFIAHELQAIVPDCVVGEKDAVEENGDIKPQSVDTSFLVATLTAAIQEQQAIITALTTRITALENK